MGQLQVAPGGGVHRHVVRQGIGAQGGEVLQGRHLGLFQVFQDSRRGLHRPGHGFAAETVQGLDLEMVAEDLGGSAHGQRIPGKFGAGSRTERLQGSHERGILSQGRRQQDLRRLQPADLLQGPLAGILTHHFRDQELPGRDIYHGNPETGIAPAQRQQEVVAGSLQHGLLHHRARRQHPNHIPPDQTTGGLGVFHLFADGRFIPPGHEPGQIALHRVIGNATHGQPDSPAEIPRGERQFQDPGGQFGIRAEHLIEIAQAKEQDHFGILALDLPILPQHGRFIRFRCSHFHPSHHNTLPLPPQAGEGRNLFRPYLALLNPAPGEARGKFAGFAAERVA